MNVKLFFLLLTVVLFSGCSKEDTFSDLELVGSVTENVGVEGGVVTVTIKCSTSWEVSSDVQWCKPGTTSGSGDASIKVTVDANLQKSVRTATVSVTSGSVTKRVQISQPASDGSEYHYKLPVIFHVLYQDANDTKQFVNKGRMAEILARVNKYYKDNVNSVDMNLEFILAETDPDGNSLTEPGVERVRYSETYPIDEDKLMSDNSGAYKHFLWDPNRYINVMVYNFAPGTGDMVTLGISHLPYTTADHSLPGTSSAPVSYMTLDNLSFAYCLSINSSYIYIQGDDETYNTADVTVTLAHELAHYLGLHHAFTEKDGAILDGCSDTDYCDDTPSYNRQTYQVWATEELKQNPKATLSTLAQRTNCSGMSFVSRNIMDYYYCYANQFTADQRTRIRYVLNNSPLIPGPKMTDTRTRTTREGVIDLPISVIR